MENSKEQNWQAGFANYFENKRMEKGNYFLFIGWIHLHRAEIAADLLAEKDDQIASLEGWKRQALAVMPDFQALADLCEMKIGTSVSAQLIPYITSLKEANQELRDALLDFIENKPYARKVAQSLLETTKTTNPK